MPISPYNYTPCNSTCTANPNPVQLTGYPCKSIPTGKNLLSLQGNPVLIAASLFSLQGFPCISLYFPVRDCSVAKISYIPMQLGLLKMLHMSILHFFLLLLLYWKLKPRNSIKNLQKLLCERSINTNVFDNSRNTNILFCWYTIIFPWF